MADVYIDRLTTLALTEKYGVIERVERNAVIKGLSGSDWEVLMSALAACPAKNSYLNESKYPHLVLTERLPRMIDPTIAEVQLVYERKANPGQNMGSLSYSGEPIMKAPVAGSMACSIQQVTTNKDANGALIVLSHTYPGDDLNFPGETRQQTGEITIYQPNRVISVQGYREIDNPWVLLEKVVGKLNNGTWHGQPSRTWMCSEGRFEQCDLDTYSMSFQFQHNPDGWDATTIFIDSVSGKPPVGLVDGVGIKTIRYQEMVNFEVQLGFHILGG